MRARCTRGPDRVSYSTLVTFESPSQKKPTMSPIIISLPARSPNMADRHSEAVTTQLSTSFSIPAAMRGRCCNSCVCWSLGPGPLEYISDR